MTFLRPPNEVTGLGGVLGKVLFFSFLFVLFCSTIASADPEKDQSVFLEYLQRFESWRIGQPPSHFLSEAELQDLLSRIEQVRVEAARTAASMDTLLDALLKEESWEFRREATVAAKLGLILLGDVECGIGLRSDGCRWQPYLTLQAGLSLGGVGGGIGIAGSQERTLSAPRLPFYETRDAGDAGFVVGIGGSKEWHEHPDYHLKKGWAGVGVGGWFASSESTAPETKRQQEQSSKIRMVVRLPVWTLSLPTALARRLAGASKQRALLVEELRNLRVGKALFRLAKLKTAVRSAERMSEEFRKSDRSRTAIALRDSDPLSSIALLYRPSILHRLEAPWHRKVIHACARKIGAYGRIPIE